MNIIIEQETQNLFTFSFEPLIEKVICQAIDYIQCPYEAEVSVILTDNASIQKLNKEFRQIDAPTDVLSFPMVEYDRPGDFSGLEQRMDCFHPETGELLLGDIVISQDKVRQQAMEYGHSEIRELAFLVAHSMLHLFGYDHMEDAERKVMEQKQEDILSMLGIER